MKQLVVYAIAIALFAPAALAATPTASVTLPTVTTAPLDYLVSFYDMPRGLGEGDEYQGGRIVRTDTVLHFAVIRTDVPTLFEARLVADDNVRHFIIDDPEAFRITFTPNDPRWGDQYGPKNIGAPTAWDTTLGTTSVKVCIVDTGVRYTHEDIAGSRWLGGYDFINNDNNPMDDNGHGTHVATTAVGTTNNAKGIAGIAQASIYGVKVLSASGSGSYSAIASGIRWCADQGSHIISMSLGGSSTTTELTDAVNYAASKGSLQIAAAGNSGPCSNCVGYPAKYAEVMAVTCTTSTRAQCGFSSDGPESDIAAPGNSIVAGWHTSDTAYNTISGTSMSTPHVSGVAALVKAVNAGFTKEDIRNRLQSTARDLGAAGWDQEFGHGEVDAAKAVGSGTTNPACSDGVDNDGDGKTDYPNDPGCSSSSDTDEYDAPASEARVYFEDMEDGAQGWTKSSSTDLWHTTSACQTAYSGTRTLAWTQDSTCNYNTGARVTNWAQSGAISLSGKTQATLKLAHIFQIEQYTGGAYDILRIQVSKDASTWTTLQQWDSRNTNPTAWAALSYDIDGYTGGNLYVRLWTDTVDSTANNYKGWFVDNIEVTAA
ncbi:MAG TPA: S8 family serine peptidase [Candidatus Thermoplasmatota archaeon]|nr:S8 family serine peptidase [Candidatus Thermoplasmatota archaeon]